MSDVKEMMDIGAKILVMLVVAVALMSCADKMSAAYAAHQLEVCSTTGC